MLFAKLFGLMSGYILRYCIYIYGLDVPFHFDVAVEQLQNYNHNRIIGIDRHFVYIKI